MVWKKMGLATCACLASGLILGSARPKPSLVQPPSARVELLTGQIRVKPRPVSSLTDLTSIASRHQHIATNVQLREFEGHSGLKIVISKSSNELYLFGGGNKIRVYRVARSLFHENKKKAGDWRTPEGIFQSGSPVPETQRGWDIWMPVHTHDRAKQDYIELHGEAGERAVAAFERRYGQISNDGHVKRFNGSRFALPGTRMWRGFGIHGGGNYGPWTEGCVALSKRDAHDFLSVLRSTPSHGSGTPVLIIP